MIESHSLTDVTRRDFLVGPRRPVVVGQHSSVKLTNTEAGPGASRTGARGEREGEKPALKGQSGHWGRQKPFPC